jgi:hypothetical protein
MTQHVVDLRLINEQCMHCRRELVPIQEDDIIYCAGCGQLVSTAPELTFQEEDMEVKDGKGLFTKEELWDILDSDDVIEDVIDEVDDWGRAERWLTFKAKGRFWFTGYRQPEIHQSERPWDEETGPIECTEMFKTRHVTTEYFSTKPEGATISLKFPSQEAADVWLAWYSNSGEQGYYECEDYPRCRNQDCHSEENVITFSEVETEYNDEFS